MAQTIEFINGVTNPVVGTIALSLESSQNVTVTGILRYNGNGKFTCAVTNVGNTLNGNMDVYWNSNLARWEAVKYVPLRYRDEDGVEKGM